MVPNNRFWTALPGLVMNGVQFTSQVMSSSDKWQAFKSGGGGGGGGARVQTAGLSDAVPDYGASGSHGSDSASSKSKKGRSSSKKDKRDKDRHEAVIECHYRWSSCNRC